jgi:large subunit ribosomal protein L1
MTKQSKRMKNIAEKVGVTKSVALDDALKTLAELSSVKFTESVDVSVNLGVDPRKSDQVVRGSVVLPGGTGKTVKVAVFAEGAAADAAKEAGADIVGFEELAETVKKGELSVDVVIATPAAMKLVGRLGQILGPKGLMPNPKDGTVSQDVAAAVNSAKSGQVRFRTDKNGIIHSSIGKVTFKADDLKANLRSLIQALTKLKPSTMKGIFLKKITLSTTMGPGISIDISSIEA